MYTFSSKLKKVAFALMIIGALGVAYGFLSTPSSVEDVKVTLQESHNTHGEEVTTHENESHTSTSDSHNNTDSDDSHAEHVFHLLKINLGQHYTLHCFSFLCFH